MLNLIQHRTKNINHIPKTFFRVKFSKNLVLKNTSFSKLFSIHQIIDLALELTVGELKD